MANKVRILHTEPVTHNVRAYRVEKPGGYEFQPGQATEVSLDKDGWRDEKRPFTFTALEEWDDLQFTIKSYHDHAGVTHELWSMEPGDSLLIDDAWGTITYKGPGVFIAGGAGVTPFIAILRRLAVDGELDGHTLIASHKTEKDIILRDEFENMKGLTCIWTVTGQDGSEFDRGKINRDFLERYVDNYDQKFYVCGPDKMVEDIRSDLKDLGAEADGITFEE
ncbi:MAG: flavodoxin reductase [Hyphomonas sp.]|nr:flavodoxin reductase [Hyphomonas sp.]|tara:strand:+ start:6937 stop:7602 length:666 start_codon:yes stop_codon:yes gene_type:complete